VFECVSNGTYFDIRNVSSALGVIAHFHYLTVFSLLQGDKALVFECVSDGTYFDIRHVSLEPAEGIDSDTVFTGPVFSELDNELQESFRAYIAVSAFAFAFALLVLCKTIQAAGLVAVIRARQYDVVELHFEPAEGVDSDTVTGPVNSELDNELQESFRADIAVSAAASVLTLLVVSVRLQKVGSGVLGHCCDDMKWYSDTGTSRAHWRRHCVFTGPVFSELDNGLQESFRAYIAVSPVMI
jgi:hypothetical protein